MPTPQQLHCWGEGITTSQCFLVDSPKVPYGMFFMLFGESPAAHLCTSRFYMLFGSWKEWLGGKRSLNKWSSET